MRRSVESTEYVSQIEGTETVRVSVERQPVVTAVQQEKVSLTTVQQVAVRFAMRRHEEFLIPEGVNLIWLSGSLRCGNIGPPGLGERQSGRLVR